MFFKSLRLGRDICFLRLVFSNSRVLVQKLCLLLTAFQAVETKEVKILLINVSETVNNFFNHDSTEAYIKILFLGRPFRLVYQV